MYNFIKKESLTSTNSYASELIATGKVKDITVILAENQTDGRGQAKNVWFSKKGESLCFSIVLFPKNIQPEKQFVLSQIISLAIYDMLSEYVKNVSVKWPNDILINNKKAVGVLIENALQSDGFAYSICGVGINVNNINLPTDFEATSLALETGEKYKIDGLLHSLLNHFFRYYALAESEEYKKIETLYLQYLYRRGRFGRFKDKKSVFEGKIKGLDIYGRIEIEREQGEISTYGFKEVEFLP